MAANLSFTAGITLSGSYNAGASATGDVSNTSLGAGGSNNAVVPNVTLSYGNGTVLDGNSANPAQVIYHKQFTIAATTMKTISLNGGADTDNTNTALAMTKAKYFLVYILAPDGVISCRVGPQNQANAWQGPWGGLTAAVYDVCYYRREWAGPAAGVTITPATAMNFQIYNPGAGTITVGLFFAGF